jgi:hypothetical protein
MVETANLGKPGYTMGVLTNDSAVKQTCASVCKAVSFNHSQNTEDEGEWHAYDTNDRKTTVKQAS